MKLGEKGYQNTKLRFAFQALMSISESILGGRNNGLTLDELIIVSGLEEDICKDVVQELVEMGIYYQYNDIFYVWYD